MGNVRVVNMIPASLSGETFQNSEPNIAVNPERPSDMVATAFAPGPARVLSKLRGSSAATAPIYVSIDGGKTWEVRNVVPGNGTFGTNDITVGFATRGGMLYAGALNGSSFRRMQILRTSSFTSTTTMSILVDRTGKDQPWVVAGSVQVAGNSRDRVFVGSNDLSGQGVGRVGATAAVHVSQDAAANQANFRESGIENRATSGQDGPPVRIALHPSGVVYAAFIRWTASVSNNTTFDVVVVRDDQWAGDVDTFFDLVDAGDGVEGQRVVTGLYALWNDTMGQERIGADLSIAVDPNDAATVWIAWCERFGGAGATDWTLRVARSTNSGRNWTILRTVTNAKNPSLAVNADAILGLVYQQLTGGNWVTTLEVTGDAWATNAETWILHQAPSATPLQAFLPYLGDYIRLIAVKSDFYGVFSGNNTPNLANFPSGVTYQRQANWVTQQLLNTDGVTPVAVSIDPFFFHWSERSFRLPIAVGISRGGITPRGPITRVPVLPREPVTPRGPVITPRSPVIGPRGPIITPRGPGPGAQPEPPTDVEL